MKPTPSASSGYLASKLRDSTRLRRSLTTPAPSASCHARHVPTPPRRPCAAGFDACRLLIHDTSCTSRPVSTRHRLAQQAAHSVTCDARRQT